jgi:hypothetical protein
MDCVWLHFHGKRILPGKSIQIVRLQNCANELSQLRSLKYVLLPADNAASNASIQPIARGQRSRRMQFLFVYTYVVQFAFMWWLSALDLGSIGVGK